MNGGETHGANGGIESRVARKKAAARWRKRSRRGAAWRRLAAAGAESHSWLGNVHVPVWRRNGWLSQSIEKSRRCWLMALA